MFRVPHNIPHVPLLSIHRCRPIGEWVMLWRIENKKKRQYNHLPWQNGWWTSCPYECEQCWVRREEGRVEKKKGLYRSFQQTVRVSFVTKAHYKRFPHHVSDWLDFVTKRGPCAADKSAYSKYQLYINQPTCMTPSLLHQPVLWDGGQYRHNSLQNGRLWSSQWKSGAHVHV